MKKSKLKVGSTVKFSRDIMAYMPETYKRYIAIPQGSLCEVLYIIENGNSISLKVLYDNNEYMVWHHYTEKHLELV